MTDSPDPWDTRPGPHGGQRRDDPVAGTGGSGNDPPEEALEEEAPEDAAPRGPDPDLAPDGANDTLVEKVDDSATAAFAYTYEADPLAGYWETPGAQVVLPDDPRSWDGPAGGAAAASTPSATPRQEGEPLLRWSNQRLFAVFGIALLLVAMTSLSFGLMWGRAGGDTQAGSGQAGGGGAGSSPQDSPLAAQARSVDRLLGGSASTRDEVVAAVVETRQCEHTTRSIRDLRAAARHRERLVTRLRRLDVGAIPRGQQAASVLRKAWSASARADRAFAAWARDVAAPQGCTGGTPVEGPNYQRALRASAAASQAKARFVKLWNPIAARAGLPDRSKDEI